MEDRPFYLLSYLAFCLAMIVPFGWLIFKASRQPKNSPPRRKNKPNQ
jgi:hypothetical protein